MKRLVVSALATALIAASGSAFAYDHGRNDRQYVDAQVVRVDPIFDRYRNDSREHCWYEQSGYRGHDDGTGGAILGAIIGGALGNQVGHGDGRAAATIAGAAIGGSIGYNVDRNNGYDGYRDGSVRRCERESSYGYGRDRYDRHVGYGW